MNEYKYIWQIIKIRVCQNNRIPLTVTYEKNSHAGRLVKLRVLQIFTLECILHEYRKEKAPWLTHLEGEKALHQMIWEKTKWPLTTIRKLSLQDALFIINDKLSILKLPKDAQKFIEKQNIGENAPYIANIANFSVHDWDPKENSIFFQDQFLPVEKVAQTLH